MQEQESNREEEEYYNAMIEAFIDKDEKTQWYQNAFKKFNVNGVDTMKWHWSWWAFGGGAGFLLYRKQYLYAFILFFSSFILGAIPFVTFIIMILSGGYATYFIYKGFKNKLAEIEAKIEDKEKRIETMREVGGYHTWVIWVYALLSLFMFATLITMLNVTMNTPL